MDDEIKQGILLGIFNYITQFGPTYYHLVLSDDIMNFIYNSLKKYG